MATLYTTTQTTAKKAKSTASRPRYRYVYGTGGHDYLHGSSGMDYLYGYEGTDVLSGYGGIDRLYGGGGRDVLFGGADRDYLYGGTEGDYLRGESGDDYLYGESGDDELYGGTGADRLYGGDGADTLRGEAGNDYLSGGSGSDTLIGGAGNDTLYGGTGSDVYEFGAGDGVDRISDYGAGTDTLKLGFMWEQLDMQRVGNDLVITGMDLDTREATGDQITVANQYFSGWGVEDIRLSYDYGETLRIGTTGSETMTGGFDADVMYGGAGDDEIRGEHGMDHLFGGAGHDWIYGGAHHDSLYGDAGNDVLSGDVGNDDLYGGAGNDWLYGEAHRDDLRGGAGNDHLFGGTGSDFLIGGEGDDWLYGSDSDNVGANTDFTGEYDTLWGGAGNDWLYAGIGGTKFEGGTGDDRMYGGSRREYYDFRSEGGHDRVYDDGSATIVVHAPYVTYPHDAAEQFWLDMEFTRSGNNLVIGYGDDNTITLVDQFAGGGADELKVKVNEWVLVEDVDLGDFHPGAPAASLTVDRGQSLSGAAIAEALDGGTSASYEFMDITGGAGHFSVDGTQDSHFEALASQLDQVAFDSAAVGGVTDSVFVRAIDSSGNAGEWQEVEITTEQSQTLEVKMLKMP